MLFLVTLGIIINWFNIGISISVRRVFRIWINNSVFFVSVTGDEILAINGQVCHDLTHLEAISLFKNIKNGSISLHICRRLKSKKA